MYLKFYGLARTPFHITPDPGFLFLSPSHREAYATVFYGVEERKGFVVLAGEVGTGKTTVLRYYLEKLNRQQCQPIYLFNPDMSYEQLLDFLLAELQIKPDPGDSTAAALLRLQFGLVEAYKQGRNVVLLIDEAQNMPVDTLEKLRMLSNLETTRDKLLQIVLVGQPELEEMLNRHELRQLRQRVAVRANLRPLSDEECHDYIQHRLTIAGSTASEVFSKAALKAMVRHAHGNPRALNIVCDNALIAGFGMTERPVQASTVRQVIKDLQGGTATPARKRRTRYTTAVASAAVVLVVAAFTSLNMLTAGGNDQPVPVVEALSAHEQPPAQVHATPPLFTPADEAPAQAASVWPDLSLELNALDVPFDGDPWTPALDDAPVSDAVAPPEGLDAGIMETVPGTSVALDDGPDGAVRNGAGTPPGLLPSPAPVKTAGDDPAVRVQVKAGDTLQQLVRQVYGQMNAGLLDRVREANPQVVNDDIIFHGDILLFPMDTPGTELPRRMGSNHDQDL